MNWITSRELMLALDEDPRSPSDVAIERICRRGRAEILRAQAAIFFQGHVRSDDFRLPADVWSNVPAIKSEFDWEAGEFELPWPYGTGSRAFGVVFHREDAELMGARFDRPEQRHLENPANSSLGGAPPKISEWHSFWLEAVRLADRGELRSFQTQAALRRALLLASGDLLSEASIIPQVRQIWHKVVELDG